MKNDLVNELRNEKYYLDQDVVRLLNDTTISYKKRLDELKEVFIRIGAIEQGLIMVDAYLPHQEVQRPTEQVMERFDDEDDVVTATEYEHKVDGQSHGE